MAEGEPGSAQSSDGGLCTNEVSDDSSRVLRAKYRDYCSARVADVLLALSPDEIYLLAQAEARRAEEASPSSYTRAVDYATKRLRDQLALPEFAAWAKEYTEKPERFESYLMGLWESEEPIQDA